MCGARPYCLSVGLILEEGLPLATLRQVVASMRDAAQAVGVRLVTGDTKVVDRGKADGLFVNTTGVGRIVAPATVGPERVRPGDVVILSGDIGRHGMAVMAAREGFGFETVIESDCGPVVTPVLALIEAGIDVHCLRDLTRGGLASALVEIAETAELAISIEETAVPVSAEVTAACELLGLDPLHVANEGRFIAFVPPEDGPRTLEILHRSDMASGAVMIGTVRETPAGEVSCLGALGVARVIDMLSGEQLPRIC
jgi:hydrogenase expression/formation protein HypE